jgi:hypothetical protein
MEQTGERCQALRRGSFVTLDFRKRLVAASPRLFCWSRTTEKIETMTHSGFEAAIEFLSAQRIGVAFVERPEYQRETLCARP